MSDSTTKVRLNNGLTIHLKEIHTSPIISSWIWYRIGSRDEIPGKTGISHWVEHMQFKGTRQFPPTVLDKAISREGGVWNAFTYLDWTAYYETLPAEKIDLALRLEADRMTNSLFDPGEVESERTVIIAEREGSENEPMFRLGEKLQLESFDIHPYRHEIIGDKEDLLSITRDDLYTHYHTYYHPGNAVLSIAGDFDTAIMLKRATELFSNLSAGPLPPHPAQPEPESTGEKNITLTGPGETTYIQVAYHAPCGSHPDFFGFMVLDSLLSGPSGLSIFGGGGISNKTSRLYRALVEKELAVSVSGGLQPTIDPFLYDITLTARQDRSPQEIVNALTHEIERIQDSLVPEKDITRAIKQARALFAYGSENITNQALWLGYAEMFSTYEWFTHYVEQLAGITPNDIQRIAQKYLQTKNRLVGIYLPGEEGK
jgi:zinc protease